MKSRLAILLALVAAAAAAPVYAQTSPDADFAARCNAAGVVKCFGFDNTSSDIVRGTNTFPDGSGVYRAGLDTTIKASGGGSLRFDLPPPPHAGQNISGRWVPVGGWGRTFSQNSTFYVQYRMRMSSYLVSGNSFDNYIYKTSIFHSGGLTCASIELTTSGYYSSPMAQLDTDCGGRWMWSTLDGTRYTDAPPMLMQQTESMKCSYGTNYATNCENFVADQWMTLYYRVQIGNWDQPNSQIDAWLGREGQPLRQFVKMRNFTLYCNDTSCANSTDGYNNVTLTPYISHLPSNIGPSSTAHMWFDEFIVSTQPIAAPGSPAQPAVRPQPPTNVTAN